MTKNLPLEANPLTELRTQYRRAFAVLVNETARLQSLYFLSKNNPLALAESAFRVDQATRKYREARNCLAAEMLREVDKHRLQRDRSLPDQIFSTCA